MPTQTVYLRAVRRPRVGRDLSMAFPKRIVRLKTVSAARGRLRNARTYRLWPITPGQTKRISSNYYRLSYTRVTPSLYTRPYPVGMT